MTRTDFLRDFGGFLRDNGITHFKAYELCDVGRTKWDRDIRITLKAPPSALWPNILPTVRAAEWLRFRLGNKPLHVNSGYRDPAYNAAIGGASGSMHVHFNAMDLSQTGTPPARMVEVMEAYSGAAGMGIGRYRTFMHIDTRGELGRRAPARW